MQSALLQFVTPRSGEEPALAEDGRRRRSDVSRARIVGALLELTREGHFEPSADLVAERAGVGRRTVFRHFRDMDSLYGEMQTAILSHVQHLAQLPVEGQTWKQRLDHVVDLRARIFEEVMPFRDAAEAHRHRSVFLRVEHEQTTHILRDMLLQVLPKDVQAIH
jgi:AcrR family transcriptional regulator